MIFFVFFIKKKPNKNNNKVLGTKDSSLPRGLPGADWAHLSF